MTKLLVSHARPDVVSGAELAIADMVGPLQSRMQCDMLVPRLGNLAEFYKKEGFSVMVKTIPGRRRKYPGWHTLKSFLAAKTINHSQYDMILANTFAALPRVVSVARFSGIPVAVYVREYMRNTRFHRHLFNKVDKVLAVSDDVKDYLLDNHLCREEQVVVCRDSANVEEISRHAASRGVLPDDLKGEPGVFNVGWIGRITGYKQPDLLIKAVPHILEEVAGVQFFIVGQAQPGEAEFERGLRKLASDLGVADSVRFLGHRKDAIELLAAMDVCCITSRREPFPRILLESQLSGCPVVASNSGGCPEMIEDGKTGLLFDVHADRAEVCLANAVIRVLKDPTLSRKLKEGASAHGRAAFSTDSDGLTTQTKHFENVVNQMCGKKDVDRMSAS